MNLEEIKKQADSIMNDEKKKEQFGNTIENGLKSIKNKVKDKDKEDLLDKAIKAVDDATTTKKKTTNNKKVEKKDTKKKTTNKSTKKTTKKTSKNTAKKTTKSTTKKTK